MVNNVVEILSYSDAYKLKYVYEGTSAQPPDVDTAGNLIADGIKTLLTVEDNKTATKGDLKKLTEQLVGRYHIINNLMPRNDGALPYYDMKTNMVVYLHV